MRACHAGTTSASGAVSSDTPPPAAPAGLRLLGLKCSNPAGTGWMVLRKWLICHPATAAVRRSCCGKQVAGIAGRPCSGAISPNEGKPASGGRSANAPVRRLISLPICGPSICLRPPQLTISAALAGTPPAPPAPRFHPLPAAAAPAWQGTPAPSCQSRCRHTGRDGRRRC